MPPNVKLVISLREDYLGALEEFTAAIPGLFQERLRLGALTESMARKAITEPAQLTAGIGEEPYWAPRFNFQPSALDNMVQFLKGNSGVIEPFQLQLLCRHAERIARSKHGTKDASLELALDDFAGSQDFDAVLRNLYHETLANLPRAQRNKVEVLCEEGLLNASGHRLMLEEGQIHSEFGVTQTTLDTLSTERLLRRECRHESTFYEISHDRLAESILKSKRFRLPRRLKLMLWAGVSASLLIIVVLFLWNRSVEKARRDADGLLSFLLGEKFLGEVRDAGRSDMLEQVRDKANQYLGANFEGALNRGLALRNAGDIRRAQGRLEDSVSLFRQALEAFESSRNAPGFWREVARTHERLGEALGDQDHVTEALSQYQAAVQAWRQVVTSPSTTETDDCTNLAGGLVSAGELQNRMGETNQALDDLEKALEITSNVLFGPEGSQDACGRLSEKVEPYPDAKAIQVLSRAALLRANILNFEEDYEGAAAWAIKAKWLLPLSTAAKRDALVAFASRANSRTFVEPSQGLDDYQKVLAEFEELRRWDPSNKLWQRERGAVQLLVSEGIVACHKSKAKGCPSLEEAEARVLEAIATLRALVQIDPSNLSWRRDLAWALQDHAEVFAASGRHLECLAKLEELEQTYGAQPGKADAEAWAMLGRRLEDESDAWAALGRLAEAKTTLQKTTDLFSRSVLAFPNVPRYVAELSEAHRRAAEILRKAGDKGSADAADRQRVSLNKQYASLTGSRTEKARKLADVGAAHVNTGARLFRGDDHPGALQEFRASESAMREYIRLRPADVKGYDNLRNVYDWIQVAQEKLRGVTERNAALNAMLHAAQIAAWLTPEGSPKRFEMGAKLQKARQSFGIFLDDNERYVDALAMVQEEVAVAQSLLQDDPHNTMYLEPGQRQMWAGHGSKKTQERRLGRGHPQRSD